MTISFDNIPNTLRVPFVAAEFNATRAAQGPALLPYRALIIAQKTSGSAAANSLTKITNADAVIALCGRGSQAHRMAKKYFKNNQFTETWLGTLADDGSAVQASGTLTLTGPATAAGTLALYIAGDLVNVSVASGASANTVAASINAAINLATDLPVTSGVSTNVVTVTAKNGGLAGNNIDVRLNYQDGEATPAGIAVSIVAMASGAANPALTSLIAAMGDTWYHVIAHPYTDATSLTALETELASRFGPMRMIDGVAITAAAGTSSTLETLGQTRNSPSSLIAAMPGKNPVTPPCEYAAALAGVVAFYGAQDPARPMQTLPIADVKAPAEVDRFTFTERDLMLHDGIATSKCVGGQVQVERLITTYQTNGAGAADTAYLDLTSMLTLMYLRFSFRNRILSKYPRHKLAADGTRFGAGQAVITPLIGKAEALAWFREMESLGLVEGFDQFKNDLVVLRNVSDPNRLDFLLSPDLINSLIVSAVQFKFLV